MRKFANTWHFRFGRIIKLNACLPLHSLRGCKFTTILLVYFYCNASSALKYETFRMHGGGKSISMSISGPANSHPASLLISAFVKNVSFSVSKYAPVMKSCVAAIISSPFLGVTRFDVFCKPKSHLAKLSSQIQNPKSNRIPSHARNV